MTSEERQKKIDALLDLLEFSLIVPESNKADIIENADSLPDEFILSLGKILAYEHTHRDELNEKLAIDLMKYLKDLDLQEKNLSTQNNDQSDNK